MSPDELKKYLKRIKDVFYTPPVHGHHSGGRHGGGGGPVQPKFVFVQSQSNGDNIASANLLVNLPAVTTAGNILIGEVATWEPSGGAVTVAITDDKLNSYTRAGTYKVSVDLNISVWYCAAPAAGTQVITVTPSAASSIAAAFMELNKTKSSSVLSVNNTGQSAGTGTAPSPGGMGVGAGVFAVISGFLTGGVTLSSITDKSGYSSLAANLGNANACAFGCQYKLNPPVGTEVASFTFAPSEAFAVMAALFKIA